MLLKISLLFNGVVGVVLGVFRSWGIFFLPSPAGESPAMTVGFRWARSISFPPAKRGWQRIATRSRMARMGKPPRFPAGCATSTATTFQVFAINCAHLGCPVRWFPQSGLFMCPCHGGAYYEDGSRASGPPERGLFEYPFKILDGKLHIQAGEMPTPGLPPGSIVYDHRLQEAAMRLIHQLGNWFDQRLQLGAPIRETMEHPIPRDTASWFYVFGSAAMTAFGLQLATGILLALIYVPSAGEAWNSLQILNHQVTLGWFIRALHGWGSNFMLAIVLIHMVQVFLFGAYKFPRELTWILGVFLLLMTLGMAFTGQVLRFDQDAYWGLGIGASISSRVPVMGPALVKLLLGGPIIAGATLSRFFALHVFVIPGLLIAFVGLHVLMVLKLGINEWPMPGRLVRSLRLFGEVPCTDAHRRGSVCAVWRVERRGFFRIHSALYCRVRLILSVRSARAASPTRASSRRRPARISSSFGCTRFCRCFRRRSKLRFC